MPLRKHLSVFSCALLLLGASTLIGLRASAQAPVQTSAPTLHPRVVFALTSPEQTDWELTMGNIRNLLKEMPDAEIEVVSYGPGISMVVKQSAVAEQILDLQSKHVKFVACQNAMRAHKLTLADLVEGVTPVPAGIAEVVSKQEQGWAYIKAGR